MNQVKMRNGSGANRSRSLAANYQLRATGGYAAFTLIELMVVIVIISILAALVIGGAKYAQTKAATSRAQAEIATMETALEHYRSDNGVYPNCHAASTTRALAINNALNNSARLYTALTAAKVYLTFKANQIATQGGVTYIIDPFGRPYNYYYNPAAGDQMNSVTFDLWSYGPIGTNGAPDMITNWK
jgi:general secretion pathway protein G